MKKRIRPNEQGKRIEDALRILTRLFPEKGALDLGTDFQMLVAVVLSARTKDEQVLRALPQLFAQYPDAQALARAQPDEVARCIAHIGLYKSKAKYLVALAQSICNVYGGLVPRTMTELASLSGVGRKTASVLLASRFGTPALAVDTHVFRITQRLGWGRASSVLVLEKQLLRTVPEHLQAKVNTVMVPFGRAICTPTPRCWACPLVDMCAYSQKNTQRPQGADVMMQKAEAQRQEIARLREAVIPAKAGIQRR